MESLKWIWGLFQWASRLLFRDRELDLSGREQDVASAKALMEQQQANSKVVFDQQQSIINNLLAQLRELAEVMDALKIQRDGDKMEIFELRAKNQAAKEKGDSQ